MRERETEQQFIQRFIAPRYRERLLFELDGKKRREGMARFCHGAEDMLLHENVIARGQLARRQVLSYANQYAAEESCYLCAYNEALDGLRLPGPDALNRVLGNGMAAILIFGRLAIVETEQESGAPERFILLNKGDRA